MNLAAAEPEGLDRRLEQLNEQWKRDEWARTRSEDIVATMRRVLGQLPKTWNGIEIDPGSVRLVTYFCLYTRDNAARAFDAFAAADQGDWSGIAFMSVGSDRGVVQLG